MEREDKYRKKLEELMDAGEKAFNLLLKEVERPIDEGLSDDRARNAMKAKKECFMDARIIMAEVQKIERQLNGEEEEESQDMMRDEKHESAFEGGFAEKFAKKKK